MNILIADPDRDFLMSFKNLLELSDNTVQTVFDGTQVISKLTGKKFDSVILNENIPRINYKDILKILNENNIPVIVILEKRVNSGMLSEKIIANSYIKLPFMPNELSSRLDDIYKKCHSDEVFRYSDIEIDEKNFSLCNEIRVTNEEINTIKAISSKSEHDIKHSGVYINSLNNKFKKLNKKLRIKYLINEGYRLVDE